MSRPLDLDGKYAGSRSLWLQTENDPIAVGSQSRKNASLVISVKSEVAPVSVTHRHGQRAGAIYASESTQGAHGTLGLQLAVLGQS